MFNWTMPDMPGDPSAYALNPYLGSQPFVHAYWLSHPPKNHAECVMQCLHMGKEAMAVIRDQAMESRDSKVGVNLDEEAANLIRFQQAYQAAAQVIQMSQRLFDTLLQAG